jgi:hypothetical protein
VSGSQMIDINNLTTTETELEELDLLADSEDYLQDLSEQEEFNTYGGCNCVRLSDGTKFCAQ